MADVMTDEFIAETVAAAGALAQRYIGVSENDMWQNLRDVCAEFETGLAEKFGPDVASQIVQAFAETVVRCLREMKAGGATSPVLN
jgi:hypothetical protein